MSKHSVKREDKPDVTSTIKKVEEAQKEHDGKLEEHGKDHELKQGVTDLSDLPATVDRHTEQIEELQDRHAAHEKEIENIKAATRNPGSNFAIAQKSADHVGEAKIDVKNPEPVSKAQGKGKEVAREGEVGNGLVVKPYASKADNLKTSNEKGIQVPADQDHPPTAKPKLIASAPRTDKLKTDDTGKLDGSKKDGDVKPPFKTKSDPLAAVQAPDEVPNAQNKQVVELPKENNEQHSKEQSSPSGKQEQTSLVPKSPDQVSATQKTEKVSTELPPVDTKEEHPAKDRDGPSNELQTAAKQPQTPKVPEPKEQYVAVAKGPSKVSMGRSEKDERGSSDLTKGNKAKDGDAGNKLEHHEVEVESKQVPMEKPPAPTADSVPVASKDAPPEAKPATKDITEAAQTVKPDQHKDKFHDLKDKTTDLPSRPEDKAAQKADLNQPQEVITKPAEKHDAPHDKVQKVDTKTAVGDKHDVAIKKLSDTQNTHSEKIADHGEQLEHHSTTINAVMKKHTEHDQKLQHLAKQEPIISQHSKQIGKLTDKSGEHGEKVVEHDVHLDYHKDDLKLLKEAQAQQSTALASHSVEIQHNADKLKELDPIKGDIDEMGGNIIQHETELKHHEDKLKELTDGQKYLERDGRKLAVHDQLLRSLQDSVKVDREVITSHDEKLDSIAKMLHGGETNIPQEMAMYKGLLTDVAKVGHQQEAEIADLRRAQFRQKDQIQTLKEKTKKIDRTGQETQALAQSNSKALEFGLVAGGLSLLLAGITSVVLLFKAKRDSAKKPGIVKVKTGGDERPKDVDEPVPNGNATEAVSNDDQGQNNGRGRRRPLHNRPARQHARAWHPDVESDFLF